MNIGKPIKILCFLVVIILTTASHATTIGEERMAHLSMADGLMGETVYRIAKFHAISAWIATSNGVTIFNGKQLLNFPITDEQGRLVAVYDLCETKSYVLYAATDNGLYRIATGYFERVLPEVKHPTSLLAVGDTVYIGSEQGLQFYDGHQLHHIDVDVSHHGVDNVVRQYIKGDDGLIWFLGRYDLNSFDPKTGKIKRHQQSLSDKEIALTQFAYIGKQRFVVGSRAHGLYLCDLRTGTTERINGVGNIISTVQRSADGSVCVATDGSGAYLLDGETLEIKEHFNTDADNSHRLPTNGVYCYYRDINGVNWFGFVRCGMAYTYYSGHLFKPFRAGDFTTEGLNVRSFCRHGDDVVIGTQSGFYYANTKTGLHRYYNSSELGDAHIVNTLTWYEGLFYIGTFDGGLHVFDPQTHTLRKQDFSPLLDECSIGDLKVGSDGRLWIGCTHGLMIVSEGKVQQHFTEQNSRIVGGLILSITFDASGNAWLTGADGCSLYSVRSHSIVETSFPNGFFNKIPWMRGALGHDGLVFMRNGPQTFYTNQQMSDFGELQLPVAFKDKWCRNFVDDLKGHYLLTSERGVDGFDYDLKRMMHFGYGEGLRGDFINDMVIGHNNQLYVATSQGLYQASLDSIDTWKADSRYKVRLYDVRRGSDLLSKYDGYVVNEEHVIRLKWNMTSDVLQTGVFLMDFSKQTGRIYEYRLGGGDWQLAEDGQPIVIRRLLLGQHRLEVRLAGAEGTASVYTITVVPSFWAILELVLLVLALVALWLWWRWRKTTKVLLSERDEIEDALVEMDHELNELNELKMKQEELGDTSKYQKVKIDEQECADIVKRMKEYLERERVYTNADLKMKDLADVLHLSAPKLSQVFNLYLGQNYYDFINGYRLAEFKRLIDEGEYKRYTITALSEQCGFKKSNFFSTFRKVEGMSPQEYLKKIGVKLG